MSTYASQKVYLFWFEFTKEISGPAVAHFDIVANMSHTMPISHMMK